MCVPIEIDINIVYQRLKITLPPKKAFKLESYAFWVEVKVRMCADVKEFTFNKEKNGLNSASFRSELDTVSQQIEYISSMCT